MQFCWHCLAVAATLTLAACSEEMSNAEIRDGSPGHGYGHGRLEAIDERSQRSWTRPKQMGMMTEDEAKAMMPEPVMMGGDRLAQVKERGKVICASRNDVPGYGSNGFSSGNNVGFDIDLCAVHWPPPFLATRKPLRYA